MNSQPISDCSYFLNTFHSDPRHIYQPYGASYEPVYSEEQETKEAQEYTFLPKHTAFFDNYATPLDVTRQSTDFTDVSEDTPYFQKGVSPTSFTHVKSSIQEQGVNFASVSPKLSDGSSNKKFVAILGSHTGFAFNTFQSKDLKVSQNESLENFELNRKTSFSNYITEKNFARQYDKDFDEEKSQSEETSVNEQLQSLVESQVWSEEKDNALLKLGAQHKCDWKKVAKKFNNKKITPHFLKTRYKELVCAPLQRRVKFTHREDLMIAKYFEKYGSNWAQMAAHFNDRTGIMLKNRYYSFIRKRDLLGGLLKEVREIEDDNREVDEIEDQELQSFNKNNEELEEMGLEAISYSNKQEDSIFNDEISFCNQSQAGFIPSVDSEKREDDESYNDQNTKEIRKLKARVMSLQSLYLKAKMELDKLQAQNQN